LRAQLAETDGAPAEVAEELALTGALEGANAQLGERLLALETRLARLAAPATRPPLHATGGSP
jgi:hypothetical protein